MVTWEELEGNGWERRVDPRTNRVTYKRPLQNGVRKIVSQRRDLTKEENNLFGNILFAERKKPIPAIPPNPADEGAPSIAAAGAAAARALDGGGGAGDGVTNAARVIEGGAVSQGGEGETEGGTAMGVVETVSLATGGVTGDSAEGEEGTIALQPEHEGGSIDHNKMLQEMAKLLKDLFTSNKYESINIAESVSRLDDAMRTPTNPLRQKLPLDQDTNFFVKILKFGIKHMEPLVYFILRHTSTNERIYDDAFVILVAKIFILITSAINPRVNNTYHKLVAVFAQSCGLTCQGIDALHKLGECETSRSLIETRTDLAVKDEHNVQMLARNSIAAIAFDNMDKKANKVIQHHTLPVLLFRNVLSIASGDSTDGLTLDDVVEKMDVEFLLLSSVKNAKEKASFMQVQHNDMDRQ